MRRLRALGCATAVVAAVTMLAAVAAAPPAATAAASRTAQARATTVGQVSAVARAGIPRVSRPTVRHVPDAWELQGVSCVSATHCVAVGYAASLSTSGLKGGVVVPITNGVPGKPVISSDPTSVFYGVSCLTPTKCVVVGQGTPKGSSSFSAGAWMYNAGKLTAVEQRTVPATNLNSSFRGVACPTSTVCLVAGNATPKSGPVNAELGVVYLKGRPKLGAVDSGDAGYAASVACPSATVCDIGGASAAGTGVELRLTESHPSKLAPTTIESHGQPTVSGLQGIACESATSCEAAEVQDLAVFGQFQGWLEHLDRSLSGTPHKITTPTTATQMYAVATVNRSYYFGVGYSAGVNWLTDLVSAAGKVGPDRTATPGGYLQGVSCPVQTECVAVGFAADSNPHQPGGRDGVDGGIGIFHLKTAPAAPTIKISHVRRTSVKARIHPPANDGGLTVTGYRLTVSRCAPHHKTCKLTLVRTVHLRPGKLTAKVARLKPHTRYYFTATATNGVGTGPASPRVSKRTK